jgi:D-alanine-D-alanine ligase
MSSVAIVFGGPSPEHDISILTGLQAAYLLREASHPVACIYWAKSGDWFRVDPAVEAGAFVAGAPPGSAPLDLSVPGGFVERKRVRSTPLEIDVVLNCCHGGAGEDGSLSALLALAGLRVTGPSTLGSALAMDKLALAAAAQSVGIATIPTCELTEDLEEVPFPGPWVVKPRFGGSSLGVEVDVADLATAKAIARSGTSRSGAIIQPYLRGWSDLNVAVRATPASMATPIERPMRSDEGIYDYKMKYLAGSEGMESAARELPANLPEAVSTRICQMAKDVYSLIGRTGIPRIDFLWDGADDILLCEVNSIPGAYGLYLWDAAGTTRVQALEHLLQEARSLPVQPFHWAATSDGSALRVAGSIASKLA